MTEKTSIKVVIDRIEGDLAVIVLYDDDRVKFNLPVRYLPERVRDGDHLRLSFDVDKRSRESEKMKVDDLLKDLTKEK